MFAKGLQAGSRLRASRKDTNQRQVQCPISLAATVTKTMEKETMISLHIPIVQQARNGDMQPLEITISIFIL